MNNKLIKHNRYEFTSKMVNVHLLVQGAWPRRTKIRSEYSDDQADYSPD